MTRIAGSVMLVTGAGSGMGRLLALGSARLGARIVAWDIDPDGLDRVARDVHEATGRKPATYLVDVSDREEVYASADAVRRDVGDVDVLVNNAGIVSGRPFLDNPDEHVERTFAVNALAPFWVTKAFLPAMVERDDGHLVTIVSMSAFVSPPRLADYGASKHAAKGFHESVRRELRQIAPNVRTTAVYPYYVNTGMFTVRDTRAPWLVPVLDEKVVVRKIVAAILRDRQRLVVPGHLVLAPALWAAPIRLFDAGLEWLGITHALDDMVAGRTGPEDVQEKRARK